jgi:hypothetical protein
VWSNTFWSLDGQRTFWIDPTSPQIDDTYMGLMFHTFVGGQFEVFSLA